MRMKVVILLLVVVFGCEQDQITFKGPYYVQFTSSSDIVIESDGDPVEIDVHYNGPALDRDITIFYGIDGDARENIDYVITSERGIVVIPREQHTGTITIELINNANNILRSQDLVLTLMNISPFSVAIGQNENGPNRTFTLTIEDDCILGGRYSGTREGVIQAESDLYVLSNDCVEYVLTNWDIGGFTFFGTRPLYFTDNNDNTLTVPEQQDPTLEEGFNTITGFGVINPANNEITFNLELVDLDSTVHITLIPDR